jgi:4-amino-4-deoxy-L-arabinose transferase-like glycosyltransferase
MLDFLKLPERYLLIILLVFAAGIEFYHLGSQPVKEYDEARFAANAFEMMHNHDYINLYYQGEPDTWVARPPLKAWLIIAGYTLLGYNEWGLRLSSGIAILVFFFYAFRLLNLYLSKQQAFVIGLLLLSVKGIIGFHVGRNADMDAELIALLTAFTYYFIQYLDFEKRTCIFYAGIFLGLSFLLKTTACFYYIPGLLLYVTITGRLKMLLRDAYLWYGIGIFLSFILAWIGVQMVYGVDYGNAHSFHEGKNSLETMLVYDTWMRFTANHFDGHPVEVNRLFFIHVLDSVFNVWNYFFYAGIVLFVYLLKNPTEKIKLQANAYYRPCLLSLCILLPIALLLTFGMHKLNWYTAPALLFTAILAGFAIDYIKNLHRYLSYVIAIVLAFTLIRHVLFLEEQIEEKNEVYFLLENKKEWESFSSIIYLDVIPQNVYVYLLWQGKTVLPYDSNTRVRDDIAYFGLEDIVAKNKNLGIHTISNPERHVQKMVFAKPIR